MDEERVEHSKETKIRAIIAFFSMIAIVIVLKFYENYSINNYGRYTIATGVQECLDDDGKPYIIAEFYMDALIYKAFKNKEKKDSNYWGKPYLIKFAKNWRSTNEILDVDLSQFPPLTPPPEGWKKNEIDSILQLKK